MENCGQVINCRLKTECCLFLAFQEPVLMYMAGCTEPSCFLNNLDEVQEPLHVHVCGYGMEGWIV